VLRVVKRVYGFASRAPCNDAIRKDDGYGRCHRAPRGLHDILRRQLAFSYGLVDPFIEGPSGEVCASPTALTTIELAQWTPASCGPVD